MTASTREWQDGDRVWLDGAMWRRWSWDHWSNDGGLGLRYDQDMAGAVLVATADGPVSARPVVLTANTPEPLRPWRVVLADAPQYSAATSSGLPPAADARQWSGALASFAGDKVYVISGAAS